MGPKNRPRATLGRHALEECLALDELVRVTGEGPRRTDALVEMAAQAVAQAIAEDGARHRCQEGGPEADGAGGDQCARADEDDDPRDYDPDHRE